MKSPHSSSFSPARLTLPAGMLILGILALVGIFAAVALRPRSSPAPPGVYIPIETPFRSAAESAGVRFTLRPPSKILNILETACSGCAFLDYDRDGFLDLLLIGKDRCALYHNRGNGTFADVTGGSGLPQAGWWIGCAAADYDRDGYPDLFLNGYGTVCLLHNEGGRSFRDVTAPSGLEPPAGKRQFGTSAAWGDVDGDGWPDLYVARYVDFQPGMTELCRGHSGGMETCLPNQYAAQFGSLYRNMEGRRFEDVTHASGADQVHGKAWGAVFQDFDGDRRPDLYVANDETPGDLLHNLGRGRFENVGIPSGAAYDANGRVHGAMGVDAGDWNGDGRPDLVVTTFLNEADSLYRNNDGRSFTDVSSAEGLALPTTSFVGWGVKLLDWDNDGRLDLLCVNGQVVDMEIYRGNRQLRQPLQLFRNRGGVFDPVNLGPLAKPIDGRGAAVGDYDNDGFPDVLIVPLEGPALLLHNEMGRRAPRAHWLGVRLVGSRSERDGLGAQVSVRCGGRSQVAEAETSGSVFSSSDPRIRFGLGASGRVDELIVRWPSGQVDRLTAIPADRYLEIHEGDPAAALAGSSPGGSSTAPNSSK